ncbi:caspase family protein [Dactylosporangium sp. NPDC006015]|uniref:caspase, EACC1-associated type n=1 Tax=Dactylosporangium sp. NPDC006015 TaxID=3154576 RepID=UPI0033AFE55A
MRLPDPLASRAVLVGAGAFDVLEPLPAVPNNLRHLAALLTDPDIWGLPAAHCTVVQDPASADDILDALHDAARDARDALVFYYAGHGLIEPDTFELYLTLPRTTPSPIHGAVRFEDVRRLIAGARRCRSKVVLLDCCYSGLALAGAMGDPATVADRVVVGNSYVLTAAAETALAYAPPDEEFTAFTGELVTVLRDGLPNGADVLEMEAVYWQLAAELSAKRRPMPQARARNDGHAIALARNRAGRAPLSAPPQQPVAPAYTTAGRGLNPSRLIALLADPPGGVTATDLLVAAGSTRPTQEVAALAYAMRTDPSVGVLLDAAARRSPGTVAGLVADLEELGLGPIADDVVRSAAAGDGRRIVALGPLLGDRQAPLLDAAVRNRIGRPAAMIALVGALWTSGLRDAAEAALRRVSASMPAADAAALADALRDGGHEEPAFHLYEVAADVIVERPPAAVVDLAAAMVRAGHGAQGTALVDGAARACANPSAAAELLDALRHAELPAGDAMARLAGRLPDPDLLALTDLLRDGRSPGDALTVLQLAAAGRPVESTIAYIRHLHDAGRPIDANRLLEQRATATAGWSPPTADPPPPAPAISSGALLLKAFSGASVEELRAALADPPPGAPSGSAAQAAPGSAGGAEPVVFALSGRDLAAAAVAAAAAGPDVAVRRVLTTAAAGSPERVAALVAGLHRATGGGDLARHTGAAVAARPVAEVAEIAVHLIGHGETVAAADLLRARQPRLFSEPLAALDALLHGRRALSRSDPLVAGVAGVVVAYVCADPDADADGFVSAFLADDRAFRWDLAERLARAPVATAAAFFARLSPHVRSGCHRDYAQVAARGRPPDLLAAFTGIRDLLPGHVLFDFLAAAGAQCPIDDLTSFVDDLVACGTAPEHFRPLLRGPATPASYVLAAWVAANHPHLTEALPFPVSGTRPTAARIAALQSIRATLGSTLQAAMSHPVPGLEDDETLLLVWPLARDGVLAFTDRAVHHVWGVHSRLRYDDLHAAQVRSVERYEMRVVTQSDTGPTVQDWRLDPPGRMSGGAALTAERLAEALRRARVAVNEALAVRTGEAP